MGKKIGAFQAKTHFSKLLEAVEAGEIFCITRRGKPVAELRPISNPTVKPNPGLFRGQIRVGSDFDEPLEDFNEYME